MPGGPAWKQEAIKRPADRTGPRPAPWWSGSSPAIRACSGGWTRSLTPCPAPASSGRSSPASPPPPRPRPSVGASLTRRGRNASVTLLTGQDMKGFRGARLEGPGPVRAAARPSTWASPAARFVQGRLLLAGADRDTPVTVVENASRPEEVAAAGTLATLPETLAAAGIVGPAILFHRHSAPADRPRRGRCDSPRPARFRAGARLRRFPWPKAFRNPRS